MTDLVGSHVWDYYAYNMQKRLPLPGLIFRSGGAVADLLGSSNVVYGPTVFDLKNRATNGLGVFASIMWETTGVRLDDSDPATKGYGGADPGTVGGGSGLPTGNVEASPKEFDIGLPGFIHTPYAVTLAAAFKSRHDDGLDVVDYKRIRMREIHGQLLNETWMRDPIPVYTAGSGSTTDAKNASGELGFESLWRLTASTALATAIESARTGWFGVYGPQSGSSPTPSTGNTRESGGLGVVGDGVVIRPNGAASGFTATSTGNLPFNLDGVDALIDQTEANRANPTTQVFLTGYKTRRKFYNELRSAGRFDETSPAQAKLSFGGLSVTGTHAGRDVSFTVRTYQGRAIVADRITPGGATADGSPVAGEGAQRFGLFDMANIKKQVGIPTVHVGIDNPLIRNEFRNQEMYLTGLQGRATAFNTSGYIQNISV